MQEKSVEKTVLVRKRLIPDEECVLKGDELLYIDEGPETIVTRWLPIKKRGDIGWGFSVYKLSEGVKQSVFYDRKGNFDRVYCDIIKSERRCERIIVTDLLVDVVRTNRGEVAILDEDELLEALGKELITGEEFAFALKKARETEKLLRDDGFFPGREFGFSITPPEGFVPE